MKKCKSLNGFGIQSLLSKNCEHQISYPHGCEEGIDVDSNLIFYQVNVHLQLKMFSTTFTVGDGVLI